MIDTLYTLVLKIKTINNVWKETNSRIYLYKFDIIYKFFKFG